MFRDAMGRMPYEQQAISQNPYANLFNIIGSIMGQNAQQRNQAGIANALQGITPDQQAQATQQQTGLLPSANFVPQYSDQSQVPTSQNLGSQQLQSMQYQPEQSQDQKYAGLLGGDINKLISNKLLMHNNRNQYHNRHNKIIQCRLRKLTNQLNLS
jgi:hypothetical protein